MRIGVAWVGKGRDKLLAGLSDRYAERLGRLAPVVMAHVPEVVGEGRTGDEARRLEAQRLRAVLERWSRPRRGLVVALDERGDQLGSAGLAALLKDQRERGAPQATFVIGGDEGLEPALREEADRVLALSRMTLTHEWARALLLEQLYRAHAILGGHPYHRE